MIGACGAGAGDEPTAGTDIRPILPTSAESTEAEVSTLFWNVMAESGATAGMHDGYQACLHPDLGVTVFDIDRFGVLVNPAFDAGYQAGATAVAAGCPALRNDFSDGFEANDSPLDPDQQHRVATIGADFDTLDSHPDFGKGFDAGLAFGEQLACASSELSAAQPPDSWLSAYPSEFQSGYVAGLQDVAGACATPDAN